MGQKVNPVGIRLGIVQDWASTWYEERDYANTLLADIRTREFINKLFAPAGISRVQIERPSKKNARIIITCARPAMIIGQKGAGTEKLRAQVADIIKVPVHITVEEVRKPDIDAKLVAETVAQQLEQRVMFRRAMKRAVSSALRAGALGIRIRVSGRLGGAEIARSEWYLEGRVPLHTLRADIDYAVAEALTTYGIIGVKVWIFKGERLGEKAQVAEVEKESKS